MKRNVEPIPEVGAFRTGKHLYYFGGDGPWPGATGITDVLDKPGLTYWKREQVAIAAIDNADLVKTGKPEAVVAFLLKSENTDGRDRGTRIHGHIERLLQRQPLDYGEHPEDEAAVEGSRAWLNQQATEHGLKVLEVETFVLNPTLGYGGTVDLIAEIDGKITLLDWKSGKSVVDAKGRVYQEMRLQLAAYANCEFIGRPNDATRYPIPLIERFGIVHVTDHGCRMYEADVTERDWIAFRACLNLHQWQKTAA